MRSVLRLTILSLVLIMAAGCANKPAPLQEYQRDNFVMDTLIHIQVYAPDQETGRQALDAAFGEFRRIADLSDQFAEKNLPDPDISDVYRVNKNAGIKPVQVSDDTLVMLQKSQYYACLTQGAFDHTVGPLMDLWGFGQEHYQVPKDAELKAALALVGYQRLVVNRQEKTVFLPDQGMKLDLGGIAKGYATDQAVGKLRQIGIKSALINAGGTIYALGCKPDGSPWKAGIQDPRDKNKIIAVIKVKDTALASSGDYERYFIEDGIRYHHILDPSTGKPAGQLMAATIAGASAAEADLLSTALFVLGHQSGTELLNKLSDIQAVFVDENKNITITPGLKNQIEWMEDNGYQVGM